MPVDSASVTDLLAFLRNYDTAMLATIKEGKAHAATIYYHVENDLHFFFLTKNETGKYHNLTKDTSVALVISDPQSLQTVQVEGVAQEVDYTAKEYEGIIKSFTDHLSQTGKPWSAIPLNHLNAAGYYSFIQVNPTWIRWSDFKNWSHSIKFEQHFQ